MTMIKLPSHTIKYQAGAVLVVSLIILVLLSILGVSSTLNTGLEERMAGNMRDRNLAFQAAESALKEAENTLLNNTPPTVSRAGVNGYYAIRTLFPTFLLPVLQESFWTDNPVITYSSGNLTGVAQPPQYVVQDIGPVLNPCPLPCSGPHYYRITVRATGGTANSVVIIQSVYQKQ